MVVIRDVEAVVVGGGIIGACAALCLQQAGKKTLILDQYHPPHNMGSSGGQSRITRLANIGPPQLTPILQDAMARWSDISAMVHEELVSPAPMLVVGGEKRLVEKMARSLERTGERPNWLSPAQTNDKYKTQFPEDYIMFEDQSAGVLRADRCINAVLKLFRECGGDVEGGWKVERVEMEGEGGCVSGPRGTVRTHYLLLCAGPWTNSLLNPLGINLPLQPIRTKSFFFQNNGFPHASFLDVTPKNDFYALPALDSKGLLKVGYHIGEEVNPGSEVGDLSDVRDRVRSYVIKWMPLLQQEREEDCWYMETPDEEFVLDSHPKLPNVMYTSGFSGTGFKTAPTIGHILACEVMGRHHGFDMTPFRASRFTTTQASIESQT